MIPEPERIGNVVQCAVDRELPPATRADALDDDDDDDDEEANMGTFSTVPGMGWTPSAGAGVLLSALAAESGEEEEDAGFAVWIQ